MLHIYTATMDMDMFAIKIYGAPPSLPISKYRVVYRRMLILKRVILCTQKPILNEMSFAYIWNNALNLMCWDCVKF